jgi:hypothetical protein
MIMNTPRATRFDSLPLLRPLPILLSTFTIHTRILLFLPLLSLRRVHPIRLQTSHKGNARRRR